jgi:hypothetical protein
VKLCWVGLGKPIAVPRVRHRRGVTHLGVPTAPEALEQPVAVRTTLYASTRSWNVRSYTMPQSAGQAIVPAGNGLNLHNDFAVAWTDSGDETTTCAGNENRMWFLGNASRRCTPSRSSSVTLPHIVAGAACGAGSGAVRLEAASWHPVAATMHSDTAAIRTTPRRRMPRTRSALAELTIGGVLTSLGCRAGVDRFPPRPASGSGGDARLVDERRAPEGRDAVGGSLGCVPPRATRHGC